LSVIPRRQVDLFADQRSVPDERDEEKAKERHLRSAFNRRREFVHYSQTYVIAPVIIREEYAGGFIAKSAAVPIREAPGTKATPTTDWAHANYFISFEKNDSAHIIAAEINRRVGRPGAILQSYINHLNESSPDSSYDIVAIPIGSKDDYLKAAREYKGRITEVRFTFVVPNIKFLPTNLREILTEARDDENAQEVEHAVKNKEGNVNAQSDRLVGLAKEAEKGIGTIVMRWAKRIVFRSESKIKTVDTTKRTSTVDAEPNELAETAKEIFSQWEP
jgi:hypothetical protein